MEKPKISKQVHGLKASVALPALAKAKAAISDIQLARNIYLMLDAMEARGIDVAKDLAQLDIIEGAAKGADGLTNIPGFTPGAGVGGRRIGGIPDAAAGGQTPGDDTGFKDPLSGLGNQRHRSVLVGPGSMPGKNDLVGQDTSYGDGSSSSHRYVWQERTTERQSTDGSQTWGSASYRDYSGSHWRTDYHDERHDDGSITSKETVFDAHNEPVKTTVREGSADGTATETTTTHETGEVQTRTGTIPEIFPERSQTGEGVEGGRGDTVAPRGWYNPITGTIQNPGLATNNNQVNPGPDGATPTPVAPALLIDPRILVVNPAPDQFNASGTPRDIRENDPTIVDPPRP